MNLNAVRKLKQFARNTPNLLRGYTIYVNSDKLRLIDQVYLSRFPHATSFVDLGGVWKVNGGYSLYTLRQYRQTNGTIVDTDYPERLRQKLAQEPRLRIIRGDFTNPDVISAIGKVDVAYFFDVLLHQANPSWEEVLSKYASVASCIVIFNQQYIQGQNSIRLTHLPLDQYLSMAPSYREEVCRFVYDHANEIHPEFQKPWIDIHQVFQWAITDHDLIDVMGRLGYRLVHYRNCGRFSNMEAYENHAFVFLQSEMANN